jgi:hypothetical protein
MALAMIGRPSWPYRTARGHDPRGRVLSDRTQPDQGPTQESTGEMAWLRDTRSSRLLGGSVLSAITDTWTYVAACFRSGSPRSFSAYEGGREGTCHRGICQWRERGSLLESVSAITRLPP